MRLNSGTGRREARVAGLSPQVHQILLEVGRTVTLHFALGVQSLI